jgi:Fe-S oxidoreductase
MMFSRTEQIVLLVLVAAVATLFAADVWQKLRLVVAGRAEPRPRLDRVDRRSGRVVREVLFQQRVVEGRKVAGTLHAIVFLGFVAFVLQTIHHFLQPFGINLLGAIFGGDVHVFHAILDAIAILVALSIAALAYRRFFMPKYSPDRTSWSSAVVAALIFLLMLTYLNDAWGPGVLPKANWWLHTALILLFPALILRSKHFHIVLAPVSIFLRTNRLGQIAPLDLDLEALQESDEEPVLGFETVADIPWKLRLDFETCVECRRCTDQCPAWNAGQELNPREFILAGRHALETEDAPVIGGIISEKALGQCTTCGACENACPVGIEHFQLLMGAKRGQALATGQGVVAGEFFQAVERRGNPFNAEAGARARLIAELDLPIYEPGNSEYLLWLGCVWNYNPDARSSLESLVKVLNRAGVSYGVFAEESCSGHHSRRQGEELQFQTLATENIDRFKGHSVDKVLTACAHCFHTIRREYPEFRPDFSVDITHHSQLLAELVNDGALDLKPTNDDGKKLTFHDPCYLGRWEKEFDAPRTIIAQTGHSLIELGRRREKSYCCGGGGGGFVRESSDAWRVDQERKKEIADSGADVLITGCPECKMMLNAAVPETMDLAELLARSLDD